MGQSIMSASRGALYLCLLPLCFCQFSQPGAGLFPGGVGGPQGVDSVDDLVDTIPGVPGEDYPIYSTVPDTSFDCRGRFDGGYYGDPEADCQAFHICAGDGTGGLTKYSFLCPNGTLFNQQYFVCDWWFNVDCSKVEDLYYLNQEIGSGSEDSDLGSYRPGGEGELALPGYNDDNEIKEILSGFGGAQGLNSYSPAGSAGRYRAGRTGRAGRRQRPNSRKVLPLPGSLEEEFKLGFSNNRNQREIQLTDSTEQTLVEVEAE